MTFGLAPVLGAAGGGFLYGRVGPGALFLAAAGLAAAGAAIGWIVLSVSGMVPDAAMTRDRIRTRRS